MKLGPLSDRRDLFRSAFGDLIERAMRATEERVVQEWYQRPPGALPAVAFLAACTRCGLCGEACPPVALQRAPSEAGLAAGTPYLDYQIQPCVACPDMPCVRACPTGALTLPPSDWSGYRLAAVEFLPERCVTYRGTSCRACADACPVGERALGIDEDGHPVLKLEGCVGCGACVRGCITSPPSFRYQPLES